MRFDMMPLLLICYADDADDAAIEPLRFIILPMLLMPRHVMH